MKLIDTHQHLILRGELGYEWTKDVPELAGDFTRDDYAALVAGPDGGMEVVGTIYMECAVDDSDYQQEARIVAAMMGTGAPPLLGQIASCRPETDAGFADWIAECRDLNVVGFRRVLHTAPDDLSRTETYRRNVRRIGAAGLPVDLCIDARRLPVAAELVRACPETRFVLDHCGSNEATACDFGTWRRGIAELAAEPNLMVKFSGMSAYCPRAADGGIDVRPYAEEVIAHFTPARMIWGGDWPVVDLGPGLKGWIAMTKTLLAGLSDDERTLIGTENARRVYLNG